MKTHIGLQFVFHMEVDQAVTIKRVKHSKAKIVQLFKKAKLYVNVPEKNSLINPRKRANRAEYSIINKSIRGESLLRPIEPIDEILLIEQESSENNIPFDSLTYGRLTSGNRNQNAECNFTPLALHSLDFFPRYPLRRMLLFSPS